MTAGTTAVADLDAALSLQIELLGDLGYALAAERALVESASSQSGCSLPGWTGPARAGWLDRAAEEVARAGEQLRDSELLRALHTESLALVLGLAPGPTLAELAAALRDPWRSVLLARRETLRRAVLAVDEAAGRGPALADVLPLDAAVAV